MADNEKKKVNRYPLGDVPQCKRTVARLVRDVLNGRLDMGKARAAAYVIRQLVQLFKLEMPEKKEIAINGITADVTLMTPAERDNRIAELQRQMFPYHDEYEEYRKFADQREADKHLEAIRENEALMRQAYARKIPPVIVSDDETEKGVTSNMAPTDTGPEWRPAGIGTRR